MRLRPGIPGPAARNPLALVLLSAHHRERQSFAGAPPVTAPDLPILEFDPSRDAIIEPHRALTLFEAPAHAVICFFREVVERVVSELGAREIGRLECEMGSYPVFEADYGGRRLAIAQGGVGAPLAAGWLEELIAHGCRAFVAAGGAGALVPELTLGHVVARPRRTTLPGPSGLRALPGQVGRRPARTGVVSEARSTDARGATRRRRMGYRIDIDQRGCITCGVCMDVCPVEALDMSRPQAAGIETGPGPGFPLPWTMERPLQVGECIGCGICIRECPPNVMSLVTLAGEVPLQPRQGPIERPSPVAAEGAWQPLSEVTREALKPRHDSPWGDLFTWTTRSRPKPWQTWTTMVDEAPATPIAPCQEACPAGTDAGRYVGLVAAGRYDDAYAVAAEVNPFPSVCGWICTAPCEAACRRGVLDEPIAIRTIKRFAAEHGKLPVVPKPTIKRSEKVAIVGGGPAGMSAAYYLARLGYPVTVLEAMPIPGGMMAIGIPEYRLPREVLQEEIARIVNLGVELRLDTAMGRDFSLPDLEREGFRAIFLATGASKSRRLGVPGDDQRGVIPATRFLKEVNLGEHPKLAGDVIVVGGGSTAMDAARSAMRSGASTVTVVYRRGRKDMPAQHEEIEEAEREGVRILEGLAPSEVVGRDGAVVGMRCDITARPRTRRKAARRGRRPVRPGSCLRPRSSPRSARSLTRRSSPRGRASRSAAGPASSPTHEPSRPAAPGSSPAATSSPAPRRSSRPLPPDGAPPHPSTSTSPARPTARPRSSPRSAIAPSPSRRWRWTWRSGPGPTPRCRWSTPRRSRRRRRASRRRTPVRRLRAASAATPSTDVPRSASSPAAAPRTAGPSHSPSRRPRPSPSLRMEVFSDRRPGLRLL